MQNPFTVLIFMIIGIVLLVKGFLMHRRKRLIQDLPTSKIRALAMGLVEIKGKATHHKLNLFKSPINHKECVYYKFTIEEYKKQGKSSKWVLIQKDERREPFQIQDETGSVLVNPQGAAIDIPIDYEYESSFGRDPPKIVMEYLARRNISFENIFGLNKTMRYREYYIAPNDKLFILGTAGKNTLVASALKNTDNIIIQTGPKDMPFYISDKKEEEITKSLNWKSIALIIGGTILFSLGGYFIITMII